MPIRSDLSRAKSAKTEYESEQQRPYENCSGFRDFVKKYPGGCINLSWNRKVYWLAVGQFSRHNFACWVDG